MSEIEPETSSGAELLIRSLVDQGTRILFGHPGGAILPFYDALHDAERPRHVLVRHEQAAAHAADGWARASDTVGVCCATSGPGATNLVTGLATAFMDGVPVVALTGQVPLNAMGTQAFQETDILGVTMPVTKHGFLVERPEDIGEVVEEAFRLARSGRPGPVLIDVPKDVQLARTTAPVGRDARGGGPGIGRPGIGRGDPGSSSVDGNLTTAGAAVATALAELRRARRPVLLVGRGVVGSGTHEAVGRLAATCRLPVVTTLLGLDGFDQESPLALGMPGMHGTERANRALQAADLLVGLGVRFDDRVIGSPGDFAPEARIVHFDIDPRAHGRTVSPDIAVLGDLRETLPPFVRGATEDYRTPPAWWHRLRGWRRAAAADDTTGSPTGRVTGRDAARALAARIRKDDAIVATDVGQHQMWLAQELRRADPGSHLTSGGLGTMGYGIPAALGAALARPDRPVWAVVGDGGFQMTVQELATVVQEGVPLRIAVINNGYLGMVRQWQDHVFGRRRTESRMSGPDFTALARVYGLRAEAVTDSDELEGVLDRAAAAPGPVLLDVRIPGDEDVFPMVPPGAALGKMWLEPQAVEATEPAEPLEAP